ncbi:hypothetical protein TREMEDRAFT_42575 [Tremella mesenterica DSM 1558]|uniref:uncharacterized protein n=1 Tax=Tremella mesenterica (strain ATCC 24925 / CBS 8224 / DSM 1558 / NBRC 9311 / NRRL Y-6157 / RJB 2259-6 / UBC 559-6) TaxID=578456 RepID=UPI0003F490A9|nr:uncharacterized protein TREMEDRAFT_42575 [Tremella mesenterica DSM 1558]EIW71095.1 hypothetical protein TREMEDRAFT_42575 [Tremella mesenterica DSM 1558]
MRSDKETPLEPRVKRTVADKWVQPHGPPVGSTFGARLLGEDSDPYSHNTWDHVVLPDGFEQMAKEVLEVHRSSPVSPEKRDAFNARPAEYWNAFYSVHSAAFFKDRRWLRLEFPELIACTEPDAGPKIVLEVGCGAGNTVFPLMHHNENPNLIVHATDYSKTAVDIVRANPMYPIPPHGIGRMHANVWDITSTPGAGPSRSQNGDQTFPPSVESEESEHGRRTDQTWVLPKGVEPGSVDVITVIYVLSALHPTEWRQAIHNLYTALKPGGLLLIRDYGRHDLAQLRIKKDRLLDPDTPNLYIRGDGTRVYFFTKEELESMVLAPPQGGTGKGNMFEIEQLGEDRRLLINRKERLKMYRIWMQVKARKLSPSAPS